MKKSELDHLLLAAVAEAIGQPVPQPARRPVRNHAPKRSVTARKTLVAAHAHA